MTTEKRDAPLSHAQEREARLLEVCEQLQRVKDLHLRMIRGAPGVLTDTDRMIVARLIRTLVAEWV